MLKTLSISGMSCSHCVQTVKEALASVPGVTVEKVSIGQATISYDADAVAMDDVVRAVEDVGYAPEVSSR